MRPEELDERERQVLQRERQAWLKEALSENANARAFAELISEHLDAKAVDTEEGVWDVVERFARNAPAPAPDPREVARSSYGSTEPRYGWTPSRTPSSARSEYFTPSRRSDEYAGSAEEADIVEQINSFNTSRNRIPGLGPNGSRAMPPGFVAVQNLDGPNPAQVDKFIAARLGEHFHGIWSGKLPHGNSSINKAYAERIGGVQ